MQESTVYQSIFAEGEAKAEAKSNDKTRRTVISLLRKGFGLNDIAEAVELSLEEVKKIQLSESL
jgi:predicted transposase YdaD